MNKEWMIRTVCLVVLWLDPTEAVKCYTCNGTRTKDQCFAGKATPDGICQGNYCFLILDETKGVFEINRGCIDYVESEKLTCHPVSNYRYDCYCNYHYCNGLDQTRRSRPSHISSDLKASLAMTLLVLFFTST